MKWDASEELMTSATRMLLAYSWASRTNCRSEPVRSIRTAMPGYLASKPRATACDTGRSMAAYQTTLPSLRAASTSAGVISEAAGACARSGAANTVAAAAAEAFRIVRRDGPRLIVITPLAVTPLGSHPEDLRVTLLDL